MTRASDPIVATGGLRRLLADELMAASLPVGPVDARTVTESDLAGLPPVVQRYLRSMGVLGRPRDWSFRAHFVGRFRLRPKLGWMPAEAWQYNVGPRPGRVFVMRVRVAGVLPMIGRDTYLDGVGRMVGKLLDRVTVVDGRGEEFDIGELTTYLDDAVLLAPSMLLGAATTWTGLDDHAFDVSLHDAGRTVTVRVDVDDEGLPVDVSTTDRFATLPGGLVRAEWRTPVSGWTRTAGRALPGPSAALWNLADGPLRYIEGRFDRVEHNVPPS